MPRSPAPPGAAAPACSTGTTPTAAPLPPPRPPGTARCPAPASPRSRTAGNGPSPGIASRSSPARPAPAAPAATARCPAAPRSRPGGRPIPIQRVEGFGGSSSWIRRRSRHAMPHAAARSSGVVPVSSSYKSTPSEYTSLLVSISSAESPACSGLMYSGVPTTAPIWVKIVCSVRRWSIALATPKSITLGTGRPSTSVTRTFDGLMSRWMIPFWCACWIARHTAMNSSSRCRGAACCGRSSR